MKANLAAGYATVVRWEMARGKSEAEARESALAAIYERGADEAAARSTGPLAAIRSLWAKVAR